MAKCPPLTSAETEKALPKYELPPPCQPPKPPSFRPVSFRDRLPTEPGWYLLVSDAKPEAAGRAYFTGTEFKADSNPYLQRRSLGPIEMWWLEREAAPEEPPIGREAFTVELRVGLDRTGHPSDAFLESAKRSACRMLGEHVFQHRLFTYERVPEPPGQSSALIRFYFPKPNDSRAR